MILNCAIIDEDPGALELLKKYVDDTPTLNVIGAYTSPIDAVDGICHNHLDILFLAIHMQQISGLEFAKVVPKNVKIIFTTAFKEYAIEAYKVNAFDYLVKPITSEDFMGACEKVFNSYMQDDKYNPIKRDIMYHLEGGECIMTLGNLKKLEDKLPREIFKRVHRSYLANMTLFDTIERMKIIYGKMAIPISESYKDDIIKYIDEHEI